MLQAGLLVGTLAISALFAIVSPRKGFVSHKCNGEWTGSFEKEQHGKTVAPQELDETDGATKAITYSIGFSALIFD